jgi:hypothetical protein
MTKQTNSDERNPTGIRAEENHWYKKSPAKDDECEFCFLKYHTAKSMKKGEWMCYQKCDVR